MKPFLTELRFPLLKGEEGRLFEFNDRVPREEIYDRMSSEDNEHPWLQATSDDLMEFVKNHSRRLTESGLKCQKNFDDEDYEDIVVALGSTGQRGHACHEMSGRGWSLSFNSEGLWGGEGMFILAKRKISS